MSLIDSSKLIWVLGFFFYLVVFFLPFLLLLSVALVHLLQGGRCERSQELSTNRGQQRCKPAALQRGTNCAVVLQLFSKNKTKHEKQVQKNDTMFTAVSWNATSEQSEHIPTRRDTAVVLMASYAHIWPELYSFTVDHSVMCLFDDPGRDGGLSERKTLCFKIAAQTVVLWHNINPSCGLM